MTASCRTRWSTASSASAGRTGDQELFSMQELIDLLMERT